MLNKIIIAITSCFIFLIGCSEQDTFDSQKAKIYVWDSTNDELNVQESNIDKTNISKIVSETIKRNTNCINEETKVLDVTVTDKIAYVNLSEEFNDPNTNSHATAAWKINSIVYGLCLNNDSEINGVKFLINGEVQDAIGPVGTDIPLSPTTNREKGETSKK